jgi:DNA-binding IclR family transcriptional regulator
LFYITINVVKSFLDEEQTDPSSKEGANYHVPNLERALDIIALLSDHPRGLSQRDIQEKLDISKNSIYRITMTLVNHGYVGRSDDGRTFFLTRKLMMVGSKAMGDKSLVNACIDEMYRLRNQLQFSIYLGVLEGCEGVIIEQVTGGSPFKFSVDLGTRFQLHCGAPGKALLAFLSKEDREELIPRLDLVKYNSRTLTSVKAIQKECINILDRGYAIDRAEQYEGCHCVGTCILDYNGNPIGMMWMSGPSIALTEERFDEIGLALREAAMRISASFGYGLDSGLGPKGL